MWGWSKAVMGWLWSKVKNWGSKSLTSCRGRSSFTWRKCTVVLWWDQPCVTPTHWYHDKNPKFFGQLLNIIHVHSSQTKTGFLSPNLTFPRTSTASEWPHWRRWRYPCLCRFTLANQMINPSVISPSLSMNS